MEEKKRTRSAACVYTSYRRHRRSCLYDVRARMHVNICVIFKKPSNVRYAAVIGVLHFFTRVRAFFFIYILR